MDCCGLLSCSCCCCCFCIIIGIVIIIITINIIIIIMIIQLYITLISSTVLCLLQRCGICCGGVNGGERSGETWSGHDSILFHRGVLVQIDNSHPKDCGLVELCCGQVGL